MNQVIRELKRQFTGEKLASEQLKGPIRAGYLYRNRQKSQRYRAAFRNGDLHSL
jgi:hypothetical protein